MLETHLFGILKKFIYEGGINTPLIAYWPNKIKPNTFTEFPGHFIDFMAPFVDLTGAEYPEEFNNQKITPMQVESLLPVLAGKNTQREKPIFWEWSGGQAAYFNSFKIIREDLNNLWELYNMDEDPTEMENLSAKNPVKVRELEELSGNWKSQFVMSFGIE